MDIEARQNETMTEEDKVDDEPKVIYERATSDGLIRIVRTSWGKLVPERRGPDNAMHDETWQSVQWGFGKWSSEVVEDLLNVAFPREDAADELPESQ